MCDMPCRRSIWCVVMLQVSLPHYKEPWFIARAVRRYRQFLYLKVLHRKTFIVPPYDLDLLWHLHMVREMHRTLGRSLALLDAQCLFSYDVCTAVIYSQLRSHQLAQDSGHVACPPSSLLQRHLDQTPSAVGPHKYWGVSCLIKDQDFVVDVCSVDLQADLASASGVDGRQHFNELLAFL